MVATRRRKSRSRSSSRKNKSRHGYFMRGCSHSNKHNFFAKGIHGQIHSKKCKCACHLNKHRVPECKCNCHERSKNFEQGTKTGTKTGANPRMKGGDALNLSLAYTGKQVPLSPSPYSAYVGKGGNSMPTTDSTKTYPNISDSGGKMDWLNSSQMMRGGGITSYANGLVGSPWMGNSNTWPGVNGVGGDSNHLGLNTYNNDVSRQMVDIGANYPFNGMLSGGGRRHPKGCGCMKCRSKCRGGGSHGPNCNCMKCRSKGRGHGRKHKKTLRGGGLLPQNLVNVGRNFMHNIGASSNEYNGYDAPPNPMPYKDQLVTKNSDILNF